MHLNIPNGYLVEDYQVWGDPGAGSILSRSYDVQFPDLRASDDDAFVSLESDLRLMLGSLRPEERLQLQYRTSSDFSEPLDRFEKRSKHYSKIAICSSVRDELVSRFRSRMAAEELIQANVRLCVSTRLPRFIKEDGRTVRAFADVFKVLRRSFEQRESFFSLLLSSYGGSVKGLDNAGHYEELLHFWTNNLIGSRTFSGAQPLHMLCAASTGYGKSSLLQTMALQTAVDFKFIVVIDDGLSWMTTCRKLDPSSRPIIVRADGSLTFKNDQQSLQFRLSEMAQRASGRAL
jgi:hypothetical protein